MTTFVSKFGWDVTGEIIGYYVDLNGAQMMTVETASGYLVSMPVDLVSVAVA
jgi:hypothetical protein